MSKVVWLWVSFRALTWWQMTLWVAYTLYFLVRAYQFWTETENGLWKGYKEVIFGYKPKDIRVYHIVRILFDIPPAIVGMVFPLLKTILRFKIYEFKEKKSDVDVE